MLRPRVPALEAEVARLKEEVQDRNKGLRDAHNEEGLARAEVHYAQMGLLLNCITKPHIHILACCFLRQLLGACCRCQQQLRTGTYKLSFRCRVQLLAVTLIQPMHLCMTLILNVVLHFSGVPGISEM